VLIIECESESEAVSWDQFVFATPTATISHLYGWRRIISEAYGHNCFYLAARRGEKITGILPLVQVKSLLLGNQLSSMPFQDYGGILAIDVASERALLDHALKLRIESGAESLELRNRDPLSAIEGQLRRDKVTLILDISQGPDGLWKSFSPKLRNQIRKAQKSGLKTELGGIELLDGFFRPFAVNMRDLGSPVHHRKFFEKILSEFDTNARVLLVHEGERVVGGLVALFYKDEVVVPWASSLRSYFSMCPNNILYWDMIQHAYRRGCRAFDFGRSSVGSGTYHFKLQWGAKPVQLHWQIFSEHSNNSDLRFAAAIWKRVPVPLTNLIGPHLRKYLTS
jgi:serine/alanine adding enzyme